ncbi:MAG: pentapeptide repeat-containing protein [Alphaproteobacteria bacterium]
MQRVDFSAKNLSQLSFAAADLQKSDLSRADISSSNFSGADLRHANLRDCKRKGAIFTGAVISTNEIAIILTATEYKLFELLETINSRSKTNEAKATTQAILQQIISHPQRDDINISLLTSCYSNSLLERLKKISPSPQKFIALVEIINDPSFISPTKNSDAENIIQQYKTELSASLNQVIQYLEAKIKAKPSKSPTLKP